MSVETSGSSEYWRIPSSGPARGRPERLVHLVRRRLAADADDEVGDRAGRHGRPDRDAVDLPLQLGQHEPDRAGGAGRGRDQVDRGGAGAAQILVRHVLEALVGRVGVDRRHETLLDRERVVQHLGHRGDAVRRAGGVGDDVVRVLVVGVVVDAEHDRDVGIGGRSRDDDLLRARVEVLLRAVALREEAGRLEHDVDAEVAPGNRARIALGEELELLAAGADDAAADLDVPVERAERRVVLEQVRHRLLVAEVVRRDDLDVRPALQLSAEEVPPDPAEAVDPYANRHTSAASCVVACRGRV